MSAEPEPLPDLDNIHQAAQVMGMKGFRVIRVQPRSKVPFDPKWPEVATNDAVQIDEWFGNGGDFNLGLACGMQPNGLNIVAIDIDPKNGGLETWKEWTDKHGKIGGPRHTTPSGGFHLPLIFPPGFRNSRNKLGPGIDTRGEGGQIVLPPSVIVDHKTGELLRYGRALGLGLFITPAIEAPDWLVGALNIEPPPLPPAAERSRMRHPSSQDESPLDYVRRTESWPDVLTAHGWQQMGWDRWCRPGKNPRDGHSAVLHGDGPLVVFTTEVPPALERVGHQTIDGSAISLSLPEFVAAYETNGDLGELSRLVRGQMPPPPERADRPTTGDDDDASADALDEDGSWFTPVDLTSYFDGTHVDVEPTILRRNDGVAMFYPGVLNGIHGESGLGKGWVALAATIETIRDGGHVVYVDMEDTPQSIAARLRTLGVTKAEADGHLTYVRPTDPTSTKAIDALAALCRDKQATLVIIDSLGEAFGLDGINENNDNEVTPWLRRVGRKLADTGAAVVVVDHVTKAMENPLYAKGSARKRAQIGGASFLVEAIHPLKKGVGGKLRLTCAKDRNTAHTRGQVSAEMVFTPYGEEMRIAVYAPANANDAFLGEQEKQDLKVVEMALAMMKVARRKKDPFSKTLLRSETAGSSTVIKGVAFDYLVERGQLVPAGKGVFKVSPNA